MDKQNYSIRLDLLRLNNTFLHNIKGRATTKKCLVIPVDDNPGIFVGEKGVYLNLNAYEVDNPRYDDTHMVRADLPKEMREQMTDEERRQIPVLGNMRPFRSQQMQAQGTTTLESEGGDEVLPF